MQTARLYLDTQVAEVQILDPAIFTVRNRVVYSRTIKVYQGIDNPIQVVVKNQNQKPVSLLGYAVQADIQDPVNRVTVNSYAVTWANVQLGQGMLTIDAETINGLDQRFYKLTFKTIRTDTNAERPLYVDDNYGVPIDLEILPAYYSSTESAPLIDGSILDGGLLADDLNADPTASETVIDAGTL